MFRFHFTQKKKKKVTHGAELLEGYFSVSVLVGVDDGFVDDLLELRVLQIVAHHHLQDLEQFTVGYVAVFVHVVDPEGNCCQKEATRR